METVRKAYLSCSASFALRAVTSGRGAVINGGKLKHTTTRDFSADKFSLEP